jgi:hypothetical protein
MTPRLRSKIAPRLDRDLELRRLTRPELHQTSHRCRCRVIAGRRRLRGLAQHQCAGLAGSAIRHGLRWLSNSRECSSNNGHSDTTTSLLSERDA